MLRLHLQVYHVLISNGHFGSIWQSQCQDKTLLCETLLVILAIINRQSQPQVTNSRADLHCSQYRCLKQAVTQPAQLPVAPGQAQAVKPTQVFLPRLYGETAGGEFGGGDAQTAHLSSAHRCRLTGFSVYQSDQSDLSILAAQPYFFFFFLVDWLRLACIALESSLKDP